MYGSWDNLVLVAKPPRLQLRSAWVAGRRSAQEAALGTTSGLQAEDQSPAADSARTEGYACHRAAAPGWRPLRTDARGGQAMRVVAHVHCARGWLMAAARTAAGRTRGRGREGDCLESWELREAFQANASRILLIEGPTLPHCARHAGRCRGACDDFRDSSRRITACCDPPRYQEQAFNCPYYELCRYLNDRGATKTAVVCRALDGVV